MLDFGDFVCQSLRSVNLISQEVTHQAYFAWQSPRSAHKIAESGALNIFWIKGKSIIFPIGRDRCRTTTNVMGDALGSGVVQHLSRDELKPRDTKENKGLIPLENYSTTIPNETFHEVPQDTKI